MLDIKYRTHTDSTANSDMGKKKPVLTFPEWVSKNLKSNLRMVDLPAHKVNNEAVMEEK